MPAQAKFFLNSQEKTLLGIGLYVNSNKTEEQSAFSKQGLKN